MTTINNEKSLFAIVKQAKADTLDEATAANATAIQSGFSLEPSFNELESEELSGSIGASKGELGSEAPTASVSHYIRGSGEEGKEVDFSLMLEGALGDKVAPPAAGDEAMTAAGSDVDTVKVAADKEHLQRGACILVKDGANGFSVRNILSKAGTDLTLAQKLKNAPGAGVKLGRPTLYKPGDNHPFFSLHLFRGNGGLREAIKQAYLTEMSIEGAAGEYLNGSFSFAGSEYFFNPVFVGASLAFDYDGDTVTLKEGVYKDPHQFAAMVQSELKAAGNGKSETCVYDDATGKYKLTFDADSDIDFTSGGAHAVLGMTAEDKGNAVQELVSDTAINLKASGELAYDSEGPQVLKDVELLIGGKDDIVCVNAASFTCSLTNTKVDSQDMCSPSGIGDSRISERVIETEVAGTLNQYDASKFKRFRDGESTLFTLNAGKKVGNNWVAGRGVNLCSLNTKISSHTIDDADGLAQISITLKSYVQGGLGEFYINTF